MIMSGSVQPIVVLVHGATTESINGSHTAFIA
jgi:hypothetical protein